MKSKEYRNMKVYGQSGYKYRNTPTIMLKGMWLEELGFEEGTPITVHCEDGILTITRAELMEGYDVPEPAVMMVAEPKARYQKKKS